MKAKKFEINTCNKSIFVEGKDLEDALKKNKNKLKKGFDTLGYLVRMKEVSEPESEWRYQSSIAFLEMLGVKVEI